MEEGKQQAHGNRVDVLSGEIAYRLAQRGLIEPPQHVPAEIDPLLDFAGQALRWYALAREGQRVDVMELV